MTAFTERKITANEYFSKPWRQQIQDIKPKCSYSKIWRHIVSSLQNQLPKSTGCKTSDLLLLSQKPRQGWVKRSALSSSTRTLAMLSQLRQPCLAAFLLEVPPLSVYVLLHGLARGQNVGEIFSLCRTQQCVLTWKKTVCTIHIYKWTAYNLLI